MRADDLPSLSPRERQCLEALASGQRHEEVALTLNIAPVTVKTHIAAARLRLDARTTVQAVAKAISLGLIVYRDGSP